MNKNAIIGVVVGILLCVCGCIYYFTTEPYIVLKENNVELEIASSFDAMSYVEKINHCQKEDIKVDESQVNVEKLGTYSVVYKVKDKEYVMNVKVVDTVAPTFDVKNLDIDLGMEVNVESLVENIKDQTQTKTYFKEDYSFDKEGKQDIFIIVEDESGNQSERKAIVNVVRDQEKPTLLGLKDFSVYKDQKIDYLKGIKAKDNRDPQPEVKVDSSHVNLSKVGTYEVIYTVKDRSNNENKYKQKVIVKERKNVQTIGQNSHKVVYLTFDDGPSANTKKILDILDRYNAKATFFVTGASPKYNYLIKEAHNKGHTIGLHTYTHDYAKVYASVEAYFNDLDMVGQMVKNQIGFVPQYIRFPGGSSNTISARYCKGIMSTLSTEVQNRGYQYYDWNVSSSDASGGRPPVSQIVKASTSSKANNIVLLAHDTQAKTTTVQALPQIIEHYQALGYSFEALDTSSYTPHHGINN